MRLKYIATQLFREFATISSYEDYPFGLSSDTTQSIPSAVNAPVVEDEDPIAPIQCGLDCLLDDIVLVADAAYAEDLHTGLVVRFGSTTAYSPRVRDIVSGLISPQVAVKDFVRPKKRSLMMIESGNRNANSPDVRMWLASTSLRALAISPRSPAP
jgi:hypothetical protein